MAREAFWLLAHLTSRIDAFERPRHFRDSMVRGAFRYIHHDHYFERQAGQTRMLDVFDYAAPFGFLGRVSERLVLTSYLRRLLEGRNATIKEAAESEQWRQKEHPDGRRFEIRYVPGMPREKNYELVREIGRNAA